MGAVGRNIAEGQRALLPLALIDRRRRETEAKSIPPEKRPRESRPARRSRRGQKSAAKPVSSYVGLLVPTLRPIFKNPARAYS
jgi:hypothetical protein